MQHVLKFSLSALAVLVLCCAQASAAADLLVWCAGDSVKLPASAEKPLASSIWDSATQTVSLSSARNEYVAFQIAVSATEGEIKDANVAATALKGPNGAEIPAGNIELFLEHYLNVKVSSRTNATLVFKHCTPGDHPAQLVPLSAKKFGAPFDVSAGKNRAVWVDIYVPEGAPAGSYQGTLKITAGNASKEIRVRLAVWNFTLPHETHFRTWIYTGPENLRWGHHLNVDWDAPEFRALEDKYFQMAHQHRMNFHPMFGDGIQDNGVRYVKYYNGSAFTERVGKGAGQNVVVFSPVQKTEAAIASFVKSQTAMLEKEKLPGLALNYVWDEPHSPEDFANSKQICKWIHAADPQLKTFIATPGFQKYDAGDVNILTELAESDIPKVLERGDSFWLVNGFYTGGPYTDSPGYGGRSIPWMAWRMKAGGWQFWDCCYWVDKQNRKHKEKGRWKKDMTSAEVNADPGKYLTDLWNDPLNFDQTRMKGYSVGDSIRINGDGLLYYPGYEAGIDGPIASFAVKSLRRGAQDFEYLWLLSQKGKNAEIEAIVQSVCPEPNKFETDPEKWEQARMKLAALLNEQK